MFGVNLLFIVFSEEGNVQELDTDQLLNESTSFGLGDAEFDRFGVDLALGVFVQTRGSVGIDFHRTQTVCQLPDSLSATRLIQFTVGQSLGEFVFETAHTSVDQQFEEVIEMVPYIGRDSFLEKLFGDQVHGGVVILQFVETHVFDTFLTQKLDQPEPGDLSSPFM